MKWTKDGKKAVSSSGMGQIIKWDALNLDYQSSCDVHSDKVQAMVWSNYQKYLVTGDKVGDIVYCNENIDQKNRFSAHPGDCVKDLSFASSSVKFVSCSGDCTAKVWDFATSKNEYKFKEHNSELTTCDWHPTHSLIVTGSKDMTIRVWDPRVQGKSLFQI